MSSKKIYLFGQEYYGTEIYGKPIREVIDRELRLLFELFQKLFPDHPSENNVWVFLVDDEGFYYLLWTCFHFEHGNVEDVVGMGKFCMELGYLSSLPLQESYSGINYLNVDAEKVTFQVYLSKDDFEKLLPEFKDFPIKSEVDIWIPKDIEYEEDSR